MAYKTYILHIETAPKPLAELIANAPTFKAAANLKDPVKIAEDIEKKKNKYFEEAAFSEATGSICGIGLQNIEDGTVEQVCALEQTEEDMLRWLYAKINGQGTVSFRGIRFVYPFVSRRAAIYTNLNFFSNIFYKYYSGRIEDDAHADVAQVWACGNISHPERLEDITSVLGLNYASPSVAYHKLLTEERKEEAAALLTRTLDTINEIWKKLQ
jgi:hypothetical protein